MHVYRYNMFMTTYSKHTYTHKDTLALIYCAAVQKPHLLNWNGSFIAWCLAL